VSKPRPAHRETTAAPDNPAQDEAQPPTRIYVIRKQKMSRWWEVFLTVYKKGAAEMVRRLAA
jgi:hypothetical protein